MAHINIVHVIQPFGIDSSLLPAIPLLRPIVQVYAG